MEMFHLSDFEFLQAIFMSKVIDRYSSSLRDDVGAEQVDSVRNALGPRNETDVSGELYLRLLNDAYVKTRLSYSDMVRKRIQFQCQMDSVASKRELIKKLVEFDLSESKNTK
jgi:hypothetical protein